MKARIQVEVSPVWGVINETKSKIKGLMLEDGASQGMADFTEIVVSELLENAIKYGYENNFLPYVSVKFDLTDTSVTVKVSNGIREDDNLDGFKKIMQKIETTENKESLYIERLMEIMENPDAKGSQFGLYRIVSECGFNLSFTAENHVLEVIAIRNF